MLSVCRCPSAFSKCLDDEIRQRCKSDNIRLTYHHTGIPAKGDELYSKIYQCVSARVFIPPDNKRSFASIMEGNSFVPPTYLSIEDIPEGDNVWFVKCQYGANGRKVKYMSSEQLKDYTLGPSEIIQTAITNLDLIDDCKYTIRAYLLFFNGQVYLYNDACCIKHAVPYDADNTDHSVQVNHKGYNTENSTIKLIPLKEHRNYSHFFGNMIEMLTSLKSRLESYYSQTTVNTYAIWGIDILVEKYFDVKLIEMNIVPNLTQMESIRRLVTYKMLNNMFRTILGMPQNGFVMI